MHTHICDKHGNMICGCANRSTAQSAASTSCPEATASGTCQTPTADSGHIDQNDDSNNNPEDPDGSGRSGSCAIDSDGDGCCGHDQPSSESGWHFYRSVAISLVLLY